jgi:hypothetical protein
MGSRVNLILAPPSVAIINCGAGRGRSSEAVDVILEVEIFGRCPGSKGAITPLSN